MIAEYLTAVHEQIANLQRCNDNQRHNIEVLLDIGRAKTATIDALQASNTALRDKLDQIGVVCKV